MNSSDQKFTLQNCPYLGLHDDKRTSLAYPSAWNYCYRAHPPASVSISHQITACLSPDYTNCPVYLAAQEGALPSNLRSNSSSPTRRRKSARRKSSRIAWSVFMIILLIMVVILGQHFFPGYFQSWFSLDTGLSSATAVIPADSTDSAQNGILPSLTSIASPHQTLPTATFVSSQAHTPTQIVSLIQPSLTPITKRCGYTLDTPFGTDVKFTIHQIASGENLDKLAVKYQTTMDAIRAVNFSMPVPVWEDWIVVIPIGISDVKGLPPFEPYQADGTIFSLEGLSLQLGADAQSLLKYNAFTDACTVFRGWLIVPRAPKSPSD